MQTRAFAVPAAVLAFCVARAMPVSAATVTYSVADTNDDAYAFAVTFQNWTQDYIYCGYSSLYVAPYFIGAFRFANIMLPRNTVITHAYLRVQAYVAGTGASAFSIAGEAYDSTSAYCWQPYIGERAVTTTQVAWTVASAWAEDGVYDSPDIKGVVQEIVNRTGWVTGSALAIQLRNTASSGGYQRIYSVEGAARYGASPAKLIIEYEGASDVKSENYIPGATNAVSLVPTYLNSPSMYDPNASGGLCWATAASDIFAYWDRNPYNGVKYWNLAQNGTAPLLQPSLPSAPGHTQGNIKATITWLATQYYDLGRYDEKAVLEEWANTTNGLGVNVTYYGAVSSTADRTTYLGIIKGEIDAGRPISIGSYGTYFGGGHQIPVIGYIEMSNTVNSVVYIHRNTGGTESEYVSFYASNWGSMDMDKIVPGGTPVDQYEAQGDNTSATTVSLDPDSIYGFRQTHNFSFAGDQDWVRLTAVSNRQYTIQTSSLGTSNDTVLALLRGDGTTQIAQDDNGGSEARASKIVWNCWSNGTYLIRLTEKTNGYGHAANYDLDVQYTAAVNHAPTDIGLTNSSVLENMPSSTVVGGFSTSDPDTGDTFVYTLVSGAGSGDNGSFTIGGTNLLTAAPFVYDVKSSYSIRVRSTDPGGLWLEKPLAVTVLDRQLPFVDVTNANTTVANGVTSQVIGGTNNAHVTGTMRWTNSLSGGSGSFAAATPWTTPAIGLNVGTNTITVYGTNSVGTQAWDSVSITRSAITLWTLIVSSTGSGMVNPAGTNQLPIGVNTSVVATAAEWNRIQTMTTNGVSIGAAAEQRSYTGTVLAMAANQTNTMLVTFHAMPTQLVAGVSNAWVSGYYSTEAAALADTNLAMDYLLNINPTSGSYTPTLQITTVSVSKTSLLLVAQLRTNGVPRDTTINGYYLLRGGTNAAGPYTNIPVSAIPNATFANGGRATNTIAWTSVSNFFFKSAVTNAP